MQVIEAAIALSQKDAPENKHFDSAFGKVSAKLTADTLLVVALSDLLRLAPCNKSCRHCRAGRYNIWFSNVFKKELHALLAKKASKSLASLPINTKDVTVALLQSAVGREIILSKIKFRIYKLDTVVDAIIAAVNQKHKCCTRHANLQARFATADAQKFMLRILHDIPERGAASLIRKTLQERGRFPRIILYITTCVLRDDVDYFHLLTLGNRAEDGCQVAHSSTWPEPVKWFITHIRGQKAPTGVHTPSPIGLVSGYVHFQEKFATAHSLPPLQSLISCLASRLYHTLQSLNHQVASARLAGDPQLRRLQCRQWRTLRVLAFTLFVLIGLDPGSAIALSRREVCLVVALLRHESLLPGAEPCPPSYAKVMCAVVCTVLLLAAAVRPEPGAAKESLQPQMTQTITAPPTIMPKPNSNPNTPPDPGTDPVAALTALTAQLADCMSCCEVLVAALTHAHCQEYASVRALVLCNLQWPASVGASFFEATRFHAYAAAVRAAIPPSTLCRCVHLKTLPIRDGPATVAHLPNAQPAHLSVYVMLRFLRLRWLRGVCVSDWIAGLLRDRPTPVTRTLLDVLAAFVAACFPASASAHPTAASRRVQMRRLPDSILHSVFGRFARGICSADKQQTHRLFSAALCMQYLLMHNAIVRSSGVGRTYDTDRVPARAIVQQLARLPPTRLRSENCIPPQDFVSGLVRLAMQFCPDALYTSAIATAKAGVLPYQFDGDIMRQQFLPLLEKFAAAQHTNNSAANVESLLDAALLVKPAAVRPADLLRLLALTSAPTATLLQECEAEVLNLGVRRLLVNEATTTAAAAVVGQLWVRVLRHHAFPFKWQLDTAVVLLQSGVLGPWGGDKTLGWRELGRRPSVLLQEREAGWLMRHPVVLRLVLCIAESLVVRVTTQALGACDAEEAANIVALCGSMLAHRLIDLLHAHAGEQAGLGADLSKATVCYFLDWLFDGYPKVLKAVHLQRYAESMVTTMVREVGALSGCLQLMDELLDRMAPPLTRGFEFSLSAALVERYCASHPEKCERIARLALKALERCCRQCKGAGMHLATDSFFRNTLVLVPRLAAACPSVSRTAIDLVCQFAPSGAYHPLLRHISASEGCGPCLELVVEQTMKSLVHVAIAFEAPLDCLSIHENNDDP